jgi:hypothetical protein
MVPTGVLPLAPSDQEQDDVHHSCFVSSPTDTPMSSAIQYAIISWLWLIIEAIDYIPGSLVVPVVTVIPVVVITVVVVTVVSSCASS